MHKHLLRHGQVVVWTCFPVHLEPLQNPGRTVLSLPQSRYVVFWSGRAASCSHQHRRSSCHSRPGCFLFLLFALLLSFVLSCISFYSLSHYILPSFASGLFYSSFSSFWKCEFILLIWDFTSFLMKLFGPRVSPQRHFGCILQVLICSIFLREVATSFLPMDYSEACCLVSKYSEIFLLSVIFVWLVLLWSEDTFYYSFF